MLRYLLDTNLCIRVLRDRPQGLGTRFNAEASSLCISTVVLMEFLHGAGKSARPVENRREVERFAARLEVLAFDTNAAAHAGEIRTALERAGQVIGAYDLMIAGHARSRGLVVVTGNLNEFRRVEGLRGEDWLGSAQAKRQTIQVSTAYILHNTYYASERLLPLMMISRA